MMDYILSCSGIHKSFSYHTTHSMLQDLVLRRPVLGSRKRLDVLKGASLSVKAGEWVGLHGRNGAGKTTLLRILGGLMPPDSGTVSGHARLSLFLGLGVGFDHLLAADRNIYLHGLLHGMTVREIHAATEEILDFAELGEFRDMPLKYYSSGMQLRLAFAASAYIDADVYLFDEALAVGDVSFKVRCTEHLLSLKRRGKSAILVSHSLLQLQQLCDRIETLEEGRVAPFQVPTTSGAAA